MANSNISLTMLTKNYRQADLRISLTLTSILLATHNNKNNSCACLNPVFS